MHRNLHQGKVGVLCLAPEEGLGVRDEELRERHLDADQPVPGHLTGPDRTPVHSPDSHPETAKANASGVSTGLR